MLLKLGAKLAPGWALIQVNFDPTQEIGPKVGGGHSFMSGPFFARLQYVLHVHMCVVGLWFRESVTQSEYLKF